MPDITPEDLRERMNRDLPGVIAPPRPIVAPGGNGAAPAAGKASEAAPNMLATGDTVILAERIPEVARYLRDSLGYELLSNITAVDYIHDGLFELIYHFYHLAGGPPLVIKTRVPRQDPVMPSITPFWPGASLQEREAYDMYGVTFTGHPYMRRVYMWDEFEGYPLRKDFPKQGDKYIGDDDE